MKGLLGSISYQLGTTTGSCLMPFAAVGWAFHGVEMYIKSDLREAERRGQARTNAA